MGLPESWGLRPAVTTHTRRLPPRVTQLAHTQVPLRIGDLPREAAPPCPPPSLPPPSAHPRDAQNSSETTACRLPREHLAAEGGVAMGTGHGIGHGDRPPGGAGRGGRRLSLSFQVAGVPTATAAGLQEGMGRGVPAPGRRGPAWHPLRPQGNGSDSGLGLTQPGEATRPQGHQPLATWPPAAP